MSEPIFSIPTILGAGQRARHHRVKMTPQYDLKRLLPHSYLELLLITFLFTLIRTNDTYDGN